MTLKRGLLSLCCLSLFLLSSMEGAVVLVNGKWSDRRFAPTLSIPEHYDRGYSSLYENEWEEALKDFKVITMHFEDSPFYADSLFYSGVCYYFLGDFDLANKQFGRYLDLGGSLKHFETIFEFKYHIALYFAHGARKHPFGIERLPRFAEASKDALKIYDEVIASLPNKEIAAKSLYSKGKLLYAKKNYRDAVETFQILARRFPKHTLSAESFLLIADVYLEQSKREAQNPDLLSHAQLSLQRFQKNFPGDERIADAENKLLDMKEVLAESLYNTGRFYAKKKKKRAAEIYYEEAIRRYPETVAAQTSREQLQKTTIADR